jgi:tRNA (guanine26-N2/guanine27-N2)-dimethyltransferase
MFQRLGTSKGGAAKYTPSIGPVVSQNCADCDGRYHIGGPIWTDPIFDVPFLESALSVLKSNLSGFAQHKRVIGLLTLAW